ncbi:MAG: LysR family transcriptional regulator [Ramlibacter sp.]|nr:LysR family transcriptional regulator [Ramlibacter sp.]
MSRFDLNLLAPLDALLRERNVTVAAERLGVSQPTMSGMLQRLREQLQDPLLVRVGKLFELTPRAQELADQVHQTILSIETMVAPPASLDMGKVERHFTIVASEFSTLMILPNLIRRAFAMGPELTFEVVAINNPAGSVYAGQVDICLTGVSIADIDGSAANFLRTQTLEIVRFVGLVDAAHPLNGEVTMEQFLAFPHVTTQFPGIARTVEDNGIQNLSETHPPRVRVPGFFAVGPILSGTEMVAVFPTRMVPLLPAAWNLGC